MKIKNPKPNKSKSNQSLSSSFDTGNLLSHPSGMETYKAQSKIIQQRKKQRNDVMMLRTSAHFINKSRESGEIESDIENIPSGFKRYGQTKIYGLVNGKIQQTILPEYRLGQEFSQLEDQEQDLKIVWIQDDASNPEEKVSRKFENRSKFFQTQQKSSQSCSEYEQRAHKLNGKRKLFEESDGIEQDDQPVDPAFLSFLEKRKMK